MSFCLLSVWGVFGLSSYGKEKQPTRKTEISVRSVRCFYKGKQAALSSPQCSRFTSVFKLASWLCSLSCLLYPIFCSCCALEVGIGVLNLLICLVNFRLIRMFAVRISQTSSSISSLFGDSVGEGSFYMVVFVVLLGTPERRSKRVFHLSFYDLRLDFLLPSGNASWQYRQKTQIMNSSRTLPTTGCVVRSRKVPKLNSSHTVWSSKNHWHNYSNSNDIIPKQIRNAELGGHFRLDSK